MALTDEEQDRMRNLLREAILQTPFVGLLGIVIEKWDPTAARLRLPFSPSLTNDDVSYHGGVVASLIDTAGAAAVWAGHDFSRGTRGATISLTVNYTRAGRGTDLIADATCVKRGRDLSFSEIRVSDTDDRGIATGSFVYKISP